MALLKGIIDCLSQLAVDLVFEECTNGVDRGRDLVDDSLDKVRHWLLLDISGNDLQGWALVVLWGVILHGFKEFGYMSSVKNLELECLPFRVDTAKMTFSLSIMIKVSANSQSRSHIL